MANWHHYAEKFPLMTGKEMAALEESLKATKGNRDQPVTYRLVKGKREYLDGRNRMAACEKLGIKCQARAVVIKDSEVRDYVIRHNITRRHLDADTRAVLVAELRNDGMSTRQIAKTLHTSHATVQRDLDSTGTNVTVENVVGQDGKSHPANRKPKIYCTSCQTRLLKNQALPGKCTECAAVRKEAKGDKGRNQDADVAPDDAPKSPPMDDLGNEVPKSLRDAFAGSRKTIEDIRKLLSEAKRMMKGLESWNPFIQKNATVDHIDQASENLKNGLPHAICSECGGKKCDTCRKSGWLPKWAVK